MFCPKCRFEYNPGVSTCPDCNEQLVSTLPPESGAGHFNDVLEDVELVDVFLTSDHSTFLLAQAMLEEAEIRFTVNSNHHPGYFAHHNAISPAGSFGPMMIQVISQDAENAREILSNLDSPESPEPPEA